MAEEKFLKHGVDSLAYAEEVGYHQDGDPMNLDNGISALPTVQVSRELIADNGCRVTLNFSSQRNPGIRFDIANLLIKVFEESRRLDNEKACSLPVQSINETAG